MRETFIVISILIFSMAFAIEDNSMTQVLNPQFKGTDLSIPKSINFQGYLYRDGTPMDTTMNMWFGIYDSPGGGNLLYQQTKLNVEVVNGWFTVNLTNIPDSVFNIEGPIRYLEIEAPITQPPLEPRIPLISVGYSYHSFTSDTAEYARQAQVSRPIIPPIETPEIGDYAVTNPKLGNNAVTTDKIQNGTIKGVDIAKPCTLQGSGFYPEAILHLKNTGSGNCISIDNDGGDGIQIDYAHAGIYIDSADWGGIYIGPAEYHGVWVESTGHAAIVIQNSGSDGVFIDSAAFNGVRIVRADDDGICMYRTGDDGVFVYKAGSDGIQIDTAVATGVYIKHARTYHGVHVERAQQHGFKVDRAGVDGVYVDSAGQHGIQVKHASENGLQIDEADNYGINIVNPDNHGVVVQKDTLYTAFVTMDTCWNGFWSTTARQAGFIAAAGNHGFWAHNCDGEAFWASGTKRGLYAYGVDSQGVYIDYSGQEGVVVNHPGSYGMRITSPYPDGIKIDSAQDDGIEISNSMYGIFAHSLGYTGIISNAEVLGGAFFPTSASGIGLRADAYGANPADTAIKAYGKGLATGGWYTGFDDGEAPSVVSADRNIIATGIARLVNGHTTIEYPALFKTHIRQDIPVRISLTPRGDPDGILCINESDETGFTTRLKSIPGWEGEKDIEFDWIAYGTLEEPVTSPADIAAWEELQSKKPSPVTSVPPPSPQPLTPSFIDKATQPAPRLNR